jgi:endonuclease/exonuclease/phosphatase family metal-dependent hydrolase
MPTLRLMTFNVENLLTRFNFREFERDSLATLLDIENEADRANLIRTHFNVINAEVRQFTALAIREAMPEVICLQEVEELRALRAFHDRYLRPLTRMNYRHSVLIEGNDPRGIDVAVLSRFRLPAFASFQHVRFSDLDLAPPQGSSAGERIFRRDCLQVTVRKDNRELTLFVCHFKSMAGGRARTKATRLAEATAVRRIIERHFPNPAAADWVIAGDLNDYVETDGVTDADHGLGPLLGDGFAVNIVRDRIADPMDRWTHFFASEQSYHQLDYILLSPALAARNRDAAVRIIRHGQPFQAERYAGARFPRVGWETPKASDHCPVVIDLTI